MRPVMVLEGDFGYLVAVARRLALNMGALSNAKVRSENPAFRAFRLGSSVAKRRYEVEGTTADA